MSEAAVGGLDAKAVIHLFLLFISSLGENYYPDIMAINHMVTKANWLVIGDAIGNILAGLVPTEVSLFEVPCMMAFIPAMSDLISKMFLLGGIALASGQTKAILYNSCIVWAAVIAKCMLGRTLTYGQWAGVCVLIMGCVIKIDWANGFGGDGFNTLLGMIAITIGCILHSLTNVVNEFYIRKYGFPPSKLCCLIGGINLTIWLIVFAVGYIVPEIVGKGDAQKWVYTREDFSFETMWATDPSVQSPMGNCWALVGFVASSALHAVSFFNLLGSIGVVSVGVMKGLTTAGYVTLSAFLFCGIDKKFCPHWDTVLSAVICVAGVLIYSCATQIATSAREPLIRAGSKAESHGCEAEIQMAPGSKVASHESA